MLRDNLVGLIEPMRISAGVDPLALSIQKQASDDRSSCLENPRPEGAESSLTETSPLHFRLSQHRLNVLSDLKSYPRLRFVRRQLVYERGQNIVCQMIEKLLDWRNEKWRRRWDSNPLSQLCRLMPRPFRLRRPVHRVLTGFRKPCNLYPKSIPKSVPKLPLKRLFTPSLPLVTH
jgi:hypothetical protein